NPRKYEPVISRTIGETNEILSEQQSKNRSEYPISRTKLYCETLSVDINVRERQADCILPKQARILPQMKSYVAVCIELTCPGPIKNRYRKARRERIFPSIFCKENRKYG